jgi:hypothetical protein
MFDHPDLNPTIPENGYQLTQEGGFPGSTIGTKPQYRFWPLIFQHFLLVNLKIFTLRLSQKEQALNAFLMRPAGGGVSSNPPP